jgi:hypothetical protein
MRSATNALQLSRMAEDYFIYDPIHPGSKRLAEVFAALQRK